MNICSINNTATNPPWTNTMSHALTGAAFTVNLLFGLPTNVYTLWLILKGSQERIASDFIPLNQIVTEILLCLTGIGYFLYSYASNNVFTKLFQFSGIMFLIVRPLVQSYMCLEQYLATIHPVSFLRCKPLRYRVACCCVSWLIVITVAIMVFNMQREFFWMIGILYLFHLLLMTFCCVSVLRALKRPGPGEGQRDQHRGNSMKKRAFKIILFNLVFTIVAQLPMALISSLKGTISTSLFHTFYSVNICIFVITSFFPPLLYLSRVGKLSSECSCL